MKNASTACLAALCLLGAFSASAKEKDKDAQPLNVTMREVERVMTIAPGQTDTVSSVCANGEVVVGGGPTGIPASLDIVHSTLFSDGVDSGWEVEWKNNGTEAVNVSASTSALCVKGTISRG